MESWNSTTLIFLNLFEDVKMKKFSESGGCGNKRGKRGRCLSPGKTLLPPSHLLSLSPTPPPPPPPCSSLYPPCYSPCCFPSVAVTPCPNMGWHLTVIQWPIPPMDMESQSPRSLQRFLRHTEVIWTMLRGCLHNQRLSFHWIFCLHWLKNFNWIWDDRQKWFLS